jgi:hypothetical protein
VKAVQEDVLQLGPPKLEPRSPPLERGRPPGRVRANTVFTVGAAAVFGKRFGAGIGGCRSMLFEWPPRVVFARVVFALVVVGGLLGHFVFDREAEALPSSVSASTRSPSPSMVLASTSGHRLVTSLGAA